MSVSQYANVYVYNTLSACTTNPLTTIEEDLSESFLIGECYLIDSGFNPLGLSGDLAAILFDVTANTNLTLQSCTDINCASCNPAIYVPSSCVNLNDSPLTILTKLEDAPISGSQVPVQSQPGNVTVPSPGILSPPATGNTTNVTSTASETVTGTLIPPVNGNGTNATATSTPSETATGTLIPPVSGNGTNATATSTASETATGTLIPPVNGNGTNATATSTASETATGTLIPPMNGNGTNATVTSRPSTITPSTPTVTATVTVTSVNEANRNQISFMVTTMIGLFAVMFM